MPMFCGTQNSIFHEKNTASHPVIVSARAFMCDRFTFYENVTHGPGAVLGRAFIHKDMQNLRK